MHMCIVGLCACKYTMCMCVRNIGLVATTHTDLLENCQRNLDEEKKTVWANGYVVH